MQQLCLCGSHHCARTVEVRCTQARAIWMAIKRMRPGMTMRWSDGSMMMSSRAVMLTGCAPQPQMPLGTWQVHLSHVTTKHDRTTLEFCRTSLYIAVWCPALISNNMVHSILNCHNSNQTEERNHGSFNTEVVYCHKMLGRLSTGA